MILWGDDNGNSHTLQVWRKTLLDFIPEDTPLLLTKAILDGKASDTLKAQFSYKQVLIHVFAVMLSNFREKYTAAV